jgi:hypothetical protein
VRPLQDGHVGAQQPALGADLADAFMVGLSVSGEHEPVGARVRAIQHCPTDHVVLRGRVSLVEDALAPPSSSSGAIRPSGEPVERGLHLMTSESGVLITRLSPAGAWAA